MEKPKAEAAGATAGAAAPLKEPTTVLELLEEDDEFEEFDTTWEQVEDNDEPQLWQDDWDDDDVNDDFTDQLRQQINTRRTESGAAV